MNSADTCPLPLLQYGVGGHGKVVSDAARSAGLVVDLFADDDASVTEFNGSPVICPGRSGLGFPARFRFIVAVGENPTRAQLFGRLSALGGVPCTVVHRAAVLAPNAFVGGGSLVCGGVVVNPDAQIGRNCILNTACSVDHDCVLEDHVHICPGGRLGGNVKVGKGVLIGLGAVVLPGVQIGDGAVIGAGSLVNRDVAPQVVAYGTPARVVRALNEPPRLRPDSRTEASPVITRDAWFCPYL